MKTGNLQIIGLISLVAFLLGACTGEADSFVKNVDSIAPSITSLTLTSANPATSPAITLDVVAEDNTTLSAYYLVESDNTVPELEDSGWRSSR